MMQLQASALRTFIPAQDFATSTEFYLALGCQREWASESLALLQLAGSHFYLQNYYAKEWAENCMLQISVQDAARCFADISALLESGRFASARVAAPTRESYGAWVCYVWDPSGVLLHLVQWDSGD